MIRCDAVIETQLSAIKVRTQSIVAVIIIVNVKRVTPLNTSAIESKVRFTTKEDKYAFAIDLNTINRLHFKVKYYKRP